MRGRKPRVIGPRQVENSEPYVDMNRPGSPGYDSRHREYRFGIGGGMTRVDYGAPVGAQAVAAVPSQAEEAPAEEPKPEQTENPQPSPSEPTGSEPDWRKDYGLRKST
ncbi:hypothetical protein [Alteriqipengyuania lutimaris]|uniref:Uncharacterized protein n=1 Tax=Alteriqipengyuania lutimaris TaxID=1538146 RepID=A0A395LIC0_9SPHN|nr:hypothetical protein [Alteriqipengyuania lutimaris]MBB3034744.1 hypothetical protein [Alteriqipengyuania lutimaris]RDS76405.1 hypothetical protein DL238_01460 [Alteriqipengyuania lutimaris]